jgi:hypothetical protein
VAVLVAQFDLELAKDRPDGSTAGRWANNVVRRRTEHPDQARRRKEEMERIINEMAGRSGALDGRG